MKYYIQLCGSTLHQAFKIIISICRAFIKLSQSLKSNTCEHRKVEKDLKISKSSYNFGQERSTSFLQKYFSVETIQCNQNVTSYCNRAQLNLHTSVKMETIHNIFQLNNLKEIKSITCSYNFVHYRIFATLLL